MTNIDKKEVAKILKEYMPKGYSEWKFITIERGLFEKLIKKFDKSFNIKEHYQNVWNDKDE